MKYLEDFLGDNRKSEIFSLLRCDEDELRILRQACGLFVTGTNAPSVIDLLTSVYGNKNLDFVGRLPKVKSLVDAGYLTQSYPYYKENARPGTSLLAMLYSEVSPSDALLHLLEDGQASFEMPEPKPYADHLEYLKDQFLRIEFYRQRQNSRSPETDEKIAQIESVIASRLKISKIYLPCEQIFKDNSLSQKEQLIFLALLKEEYGGENETLRDLNALVGLVSRGEMERMKARSLLEEGSNLIESGLVDYDEVWTPITNVVSRNFFITDEVLGAVMHPQNERKSKKLKLESMVKDSEIFELIEPTSDLDAVVLNKQTRELLDNILKQVDKNVLARLNAWGVKSRKNIDVKVIFYGSPGTGKTMSAISLAKSLKKQVLSFDCSKILSKYVGESEQNVRKIFDTYRDICAKTKSEPVLLLNEADQFLSTRVETSSGADKMHNQMQNIFLEQIERFEGVLIATTNFMQSLDHAFSRRFDYKIEFKKPTYEERLEIWKRALPKNAEFEAEFDAGKLAKFELSGAQIVLVVKNAALKTAISEDGIFRMATFEEEIKREVSSAFGEDKKVGLL